MARPHRFAPHICSALLGACTFQAGVQNLPPPLPDAEPAPAPKDSPDRFTSASPSQKYRDLIKALKLTDDPALPTEHLQDAAYRKKIEEALALEANELSCQSFKLVKETKEEGLHRAVVAFRVPRYSKDLMAVLLLPDSKNPVPVMVYAHSGYGGKVTFDEVTSLLEPVKDKLAVAIPLFAEEEISLGEEAVKGIGDEAGFFAEVDTFYGLTTCLHNKADSISVGGKKLSERLKQENTDVTGARALAAGSGRGGLIALLAVARSGAWAMAQKSGVETWAHYACAALVSPLLTLYGAEERLLLSDLVEGRTEESKYKLIPGVVGLRRQLFKDYRDGKKSADEVAFALLQRDGFMAIPFADLALKDFAGTRNDKGPPSGALAILHSTRRTDFPVNQSRIFANIAATVWFETDKSTNATNFLLREFPTGEAEEKSSYESFLTPEFLAATGTKIPDSFIRPPDSVKDKEKEYKFLIRGRFLENSEGLTPSQTLELFLRNSCGV